MSSLSNLPYGKILDYWYEKLKGKSYRYKFLITKTIEVFTFKSHSNNISNRHNYFEFPVSIKNIIPENPKLSIVIPTFIETAKDKQDIAALLQSINDQIQKPHKVIIIDDTSPITYTFPEAINVYQLKQNSWPAKARNIGKKIALDYNSDIIAFTDTDCILSNNWTETITQSFIERRELQILSGNTLAYDRNWFGTYHNINGTLNGRKLKNSENLLYGTTANLAITKQVTQNIDFNEEFPMAAGEDIEFCFKANQQGFKIKHIPTMTIFHNFGYQKNLIKNIIQFRRPFKKYAQGEKVLLKIIPNYYTYFDKTEEIPSTLINKQQSLILPTS